MHTLFTHYCILPTETDFQKPTETKESLLKDSPLYVVQGVSRLVDITAGSDFLGLCDEKCSYKHVSDFGRLRSYGHFLFPVNALV
jgi:hypothetical protein